MWVLRCGACSVGRERAWLYQCCPTVNPQPPTPQYPTNPTPTPQPTSWDEAAPQPLHNPLALTLLRRALADPDIAAFVSKAPGGLGLTLILAARQEPFRQWGAHLAGFGAQAALVAESPYYKMLIGRVLGYSEANILHHIKVELWGAEGVGGPDAMLCPTHLPPPLEAAAKTSAPD